MTSTLSRAFTTRRTNKPGSDGSPPIPKRSLTTKHSDTIRQQKISHPVELISTTNMLSYSAPDIYPRSRSSSNSSVESMTSGSSASDGSPSSVATPITSPEASSNDSSPIAKMPDLNNLSCYFPATPADTDAPKIPQRSPSHTKKNSEIIARKRSMSKMATPKSSISLSSRTLSSSTNYFQAPMSPGRASTHKSSISHKSSLSHKSSISTRSSINMFSSHPESAEHPFGNELAQVSELAEEFGSSKEQQKIPILDPEEQELISLGLFKFAADDYMDELQGLFITAFGELPKQPTTLWI